MVTCNFDSIQKMERPRRSVHGSSSSSGFRLLDGCDTVSSRNSIYKLKIDAMFDDTKSIASRMDSSQRSRRSRHPSIAGSMNRGSSQRGSFGTTANARSRNGSTRSTNRNNQMNVTRTMTTTTTTASSFIEYGVECVNNKVQKQIERMFTDVAKDESSCCFPVRCLGSLPLHGKVTSLFDMQEPLRRLYLSGAGHGVSIALHSVLFLFFCLIELSIENSEI